MLTLDLRYQWESFDAHYQCQFPSGMTTVLGVSGSGKSTLLQLIGGFLKGDGDIQFSGVSLLSLEPYLRPVTTLFQSDNLFPQLTVWDNVAIGLSAKLVLSSEQKQEVLEAIEKTQLSGFADQFPHALSGGQAQRVALARALVRQRPILLLDEPFSALDPALRHEMLQLVSELTATLSLTTLLISHHPDEAITVGGEIVLIDGGRIVSQGGVDLLQNEALNAPISRYLGKTV